MTAHVLLNLLYRRLVGLVSVFLAGLMSLSVAHAAVSGDQIESAEDLREYVAKNTDQMVDRLDELRDQYDANDDTFYREMEKELESFIDFRRIAARVMSRYARQASAEQRDAFVEKFKRSLFDTYARALAETSDFKIEVTQARFLAENRDRAAVDLLITSETGKSYSVSYSLFKNSDGRWMMENVIVEGVNIGLAFRDRFQQDMEKRRGDLQAVIDNWSGEVEALEEKTEQGAGTGG